MSSLSLQKLDILIEISQPWDSGVVNSSSSQPKERTESRVRATQFLKTKFRPNSHLARLDIDIDIENE